MSLCIRPSARVNVSEDGCLRRVYAEMHKVDRDIQREPAADIDQTTYAAVLVSEKNSEIASLAEGPRGSV
jgi:hypothetical protein